MNARDTKSFILIFGTGAFALVAVTGLFSGREADLVLRDAALACLGSALIGRWFGRFVHRTAAQPSAPPSQTVPPPAERPAPARPAAVPPTPPARTR